MYYGFSYMKTPSPQTELESCNSKQYKGMIHKCAIHYTAKVFITHTHTDFEYNT